MQKINISGTDRPQWHTPEEIRAAAAEGLRLRLRGGKHHPDILCRLAANCGGWCTVVTDSGAILHAWAGEFAAA